MTPRTNSQSEFSRRVIANIERLSAIAGISNATLIADSGLSRNYFYTRMRGEASFNTEDIQGLATVLRVDASELTAAPLGTAERSIRIPGHELARRLQLLSVPDQSLPDQLADRLTSIGVKKPETLWRELISGSASIHSELVLAEVAKFFDVPADYLNEPNAVKLVDQVEAELELREALRQTGGKAVAARALGTVTPDALRAIARAIRSTDGVGSPD